MNNKLLSLVLLSAAASAHAVDSGKIYESKKWDNGFEVVTIENRKVPLATIVLVCHAGAMTESPDNNGLTHLWEHMFFKGNAKIPNQEAFHRRIRQLGIEYNGDTHAEMVRYFFTLPSAHLEEGIDFMASAIRTPLLDKEEMERERRVVLDEYDRNASNPAFDMWNLERDIMYRDKGYLRDPLGVRTIIEKATREQLLAIRDKVFVPANCALVVSGDVDPARAFAAADKQFADWRSPDGWEAPKANEFPPFPSKNIEFVMTRPHAENVAIGMTFEGPKARDNAKDTFAADMLTSLLHHSATPFFKKFIDSGLTLGAGFSYHTQWQVGELEIGADTQPERALEVKKALVEEYPHWADEGYFTDAVLEDVRRGLLIEHKRELNTPSHFGNTLAFWWAVTGLEYYDAYLDNLRATSLADIRAFVTKYLVGKPSILSMFLSPEAAQKTGIKDNSDAAVAQYGQNGQRK